MKAMRWLAFLGALLTAGAAQAQWTVIDLHPAGTVISGAAGGSGNVQVGVAWTQDASGQQSPRASLWTGSAASWVDLTPAGSYGGEARGASGGQQVGRAFFVDAPFQRAVLWSGSAASWVDLNPAGANNSAAFGVGGGQQVGLVGAFFGGAFTFHASAWSGSAASWVDLHPGAAGATASEAWGTDGIRQVGRATVGGAMHASLWSGTAASWVDLHPSSSLASIALAVDGGQQAGYALVGGLSHASLWSGSAGSWVDLNPSGSPSSAVQGAGGGKQVGYAYTSDGSAVHAALWSGTAASWVDLHQFLPPDFHDSAASSISSDGAFVYVTGSGFNLTTGQDEALLWKMAQQSVLVFEVGGVRRAGSSDNVQVKYSVRNPSTSQTVTGIQVTAATLDGVAANQVFPIALADLPPGTSSSLASLNFKNVPAGNRTLAVTLSTSQGPLPQQTFIVVVP